MPVPCLTPLQTYDKYRRKHEVQTNIDCLFCYSHTTSDTRIYNNQTLLTSELSTQPVQPVLPAESIVNNDAERTIVDTELQLTAGSATRIQLLTQEYTTFKHYSNQNLAPSLCSLCYLTMAESIVNNNAEQTIVDSELILTAGSATRIQLLTREYTTFKHYSNQNLAPSLCSLCYLTMAESIVNNDAELTIVDSESMLVLLLS
ncbi:hypothetical protein J6590_057524 [Homalodisca vitripennis]|nr:hypothetical protein J6590_057524 [Homalodisca vitripennis]